MLRHGAQGLRAVGIGVTLGVVLLTGCAAIKQSVGGWFGAATPTPASTPAPTPRTAPAGAAARRVYYAGEDGLEVYSEPSASSKRVGKLSLYEKVVRSKLERGYAYVESAKSGVKGWVDNAHLIWRLPSAPTTGTPAPTGPQAPEPEAPALEEPQGAVAPEATAAALEVPPTPTTAPVPAAPSAPTVTPRGIAPSIFNPY